jgi:hypothetical protein
MQTLYRTWIVAGACWLASCAADGPTEVAADLEPLSKPISICGFAHPESVAARGRHRYVSNIGAVQDPTALDGDGFISDMDAQGNVLELTAFKPEDTALNAPKGLAVVADRLYVADLDRVVGFDVDTRERVFEALWQPGAPTLLNDLAVLNDHALLVSDTLGGTLLRLDLDTKQFELLASAIPGANGIAIDARHQRVWIVGVGADFNGGGLFAFDLDRPERGAQRVEGPFGVLDGIALLPNAELLISDWVSNAEPVPGRLFVVTASGKREHPIELGDDLHGPADFYLDHKRDALWIPAMTDNCVRVIAAPRR